MEMSVGEETAKTGGGASETNQTPSLQPPPQQCAETQRNSNTSTMTTEAPSVTPSPPVPPSGSATAAADLPASSPVLSSLMEQNHTISLDARSNNPENGGQKNNNNNNNAARGNENRIYRRNSFSHSKQQQKLNKRRNTSNFGFKHPASGGGGKRRRRANSESDSVLPSNFLLGGNIFDPLNLNSLLDEEVSKTINAETPKSSPLPSKSRDPVEILIPRDITDPLNLNSGIADRRGFLAGPFRSGGARRRHRNRHHGGGGGGGVSTTHVEFSESSGGRNGGEVKATAAAAASSSLPLSTPSSSSSSAASCPAAPDDPKGGGPCTLPSRVPEDSHGSKEAERTTTTTSSSREEVAAPSASSAPHVRAQSADEYSSSSATTTNQQQQHSSSRRKRRRNSGKMEPPSRVSTTSSSSTTSSAPPAAKPPAGGRPGGGDHRASSGKSTQSSSSFHTPRPSGTQGGGGRPPQQKKQPQKVFQYGNYNKYYGYRNPGAKEDSRLRALRRHWFEGKDVLDLGCNSGHLTLYIAKALKPAHILGLDIDKNLIYMARKNIRHYLSAELQAHGAARRPAAPTTQAGTSTKKEEANGKDTLAGREENQDRRLDGSAAENGNAVGPERGGEGAPPPVEEARQSSSSKDHHRPSVDNGKEPRPEEEAGIQTERMDCGKAPAAVAVSSSSSAVERASTSFSFPVSLQISRGPIAAPPLTETPTVRPGEFPSNVSFIKANYVLENDSLLLTQRAEYDVVMCMSVTKWIHLNWGDGGLKRLFHRVYRHLRPGGLFILEPQPWDSYARRKKLTETIFRNYHSIRLKPEQFSVFLTSEVGFSSYELIGTPECRLRGFQRPIYLFHK